MTSGYLIPIGGAEDRTPGSTILRRFVDVAGGKRAKIAIIPTASESADTGPSYVEAFRDLGVRTAKSFPFEQRRDCEREDWLASLNRADAVFLTGGNQLRISTTLGGTPVAELLRRRHLEGLHIAGTSAGAAVLSEHMIAFGTEGPTPRHAAVTLSPGLGLLKLAIVDQHFRQRDRIGRLLTALAYNPRPLGLGIDENTAAFIAPDATLEVVGSGAVTVVDAAEVDYSTIHSTNGHQAVSLTNVRLHILAQGATFNLETRKPETAGSTAAGLRQR